jgi:hypothetical protein
MFNKVSVMGRVAEVMVYGEGLVVVDSSFDWVEGTVNITEYPCGEVFERNCGWKSFFFGLGFVLVLVGKFFL